MGGPDVSVDGRTLARAGLIVTAAFLASRLLGWIRVAVFSAVFGASADLDAYFAAFRIPDLIFQLVAAGALSSALIPVLSGLLADGDERHSWRLVGTITNLMLLGLVVLSIVLGILAPEVMRLITPGFDQRQLDLTVRLSRIMLLSPVFLGLGAVATSALNALNRFTAAAFAPVLYNLAIIAAAVTLSRPLGVTALALGVVAGSFLNVGIQVVALARSGRFHFDLGLDLGDAATRQVLLLVAPRALGLGATQITFIVNTTLASGLGAGAIVVYNLAFTLLQLPLGVIGVPLGVVLLPSMSHAFATGAWRTYGQLVLRPLRLMLYLMLFLTALMMVLRGQLVTLLLEYGRFSTQAVQETSQALLFFLLGLAAESLVVVLARAFYAGRETRIPVLAAVAAVAVNVIVSVATVGRLGVAGLALGIGVGAWLEAGILVFLLERRLPGVDLGPSLARAAATFGAGALLAGIGTLIALQALSGIAGASPDRIWVLFETVVAGGVGAGVYAAYSAAAHIPEFRQSLSLLANAVRRVGPTSGPSVGS